MGVLDLKLPGLQAHVPTASRILENYFDAQLNFDGLYVWDKPRLSGYLVCLIHLVSLLQPNKPDRPNRPNEQADWQDFFSILPPADHHNHASRRSISGS